MPSLFHLGPANGLMAGYYKQIELYFYLEFNVKYITIKSLNFLLKILNTV